MDRLIMLAGIFCRNDIHSSAELEVLLSFVILILYCYRGYHKFKKVQTGATQFYYYCSKFWVVRSAHVRISDEMLLEVTVVCVVASFRSQEKAR